MDTYWYLFALKPYARALDNTMYWAFYYSEISQGIMIASSSEVLPCISHCAFPYMNDFTSSFPTAQWGTQGRDYYPHLTDEETEKQHIYLEWPPAACEEHRLGDGHTAGCMCCPHCSDMLQAWGEIVDSPLSWSVQWDQVSVALLLYGPRVLGLVAHLNQPKSCFLKIPMSRHYPEILIQLDWSRTQESVFFKRPPPPQEILICIHRWKPLVFRPY